MQTEIKKLTEEIQNLPAGQSIGLDVIKQVQSIVNIPVYRNILFEDFLGRYFEFVAVERSAKTAKHISQILRHMKRFGWPKHLADINEKYLQDFKLWFIRRGTGNAGTNRYIRGVKAMMRWAEDKKLVPPQNWRLISKLKERKGRLIFYTAQELKRLIDTAKGKWKLAVMLGGRAGLRRGEIAALKWSDIDFAANSMYIAPAKTANDRYVPMCEDLRAALLAAEPTAKSELVVDMAEMKTRKRGIFNVEYLGCGFRKIRDEAGLKDKGSLHTLRHTFASHLVQNNVDLYHVSKLLGHTSAETTRLYGHLALNHLQNDVSKLPLMSAA
ncbi:MAG: tyrosine-type recombinase/integrase [Elusimicrobiota bacterium]|jgi:integrase|nr:tyrosine-type recombinase/integrase [Elusimicrobiota bacterium]